MATKFNFSDLLKYLPEILKLAPYLGVLIAVSSQIAEDLKDDGDSAAKKVADVIVDVLDTAGPVIIANNPKYAAVFQQLFLNLSKTAKDFAQSGV